MLRGVGGLIAAVSCVLLATVSAVAADAVTKPTLVDSVEARYPEGARGAAEVVLSVLIAEDGRVTEVEARSGEPPFEGAARAAVARWTFAPAMRDNVPVKARILVKITFTEPAPAAAPPVPSGVPQPAAAVPAEVAAPPAPPAPTVEISIEGERAEDLSAIHIPRGDTRLIPGAFADPFRVVEILPGVAPVLSGLPYFFVRGAPPGNVGYFIDGIRVPLLFHVGAGPSVIAPALVDSVELVPSAYPARFGRFAGGIMAGETTAPSTVPRAEAQARVFDAGAMVEQPFAGGRGSALVAGRYSYTQALLALVAPEYGLGYWDYQARVSYATSRADRVSVFAFGAFDHLGNEELDRTLFDVQFHRIDLRWDHRTESSRARLALTLGADKRLNADEGDPGPNGISKSRQIGLRFEGAHKLAGQAELRGGMDGIAERYEPELEQLPRGLVSYAARTDANLGVWTELSLKPRRGFEIVPGFRFDMSRSRGKSYSYPEPRLSTRVRIAPRLAWLTGFGLAHQLPTYRVYVPGAPVSGLELNEQRAYQATQGLEVALPQAMYGRATVFHSFLEARSAGLTGRNYGLELFLRRDFAQRLGGFLSYTLSRTERTSGPSTFLAGFDRPHVLSAVLGYDLGGGFRVGGRAYYASGRHYTLACPTPDCGPASDAGTGELFVQQGRMKGFFRLDARFEKRWRFQSGSWVAATFEWFNALLSSETQTRVWHPQVGVRTETRSPLTLPSIGIEAGY
ncbi:MAG: TonB family protein [Myxococcales bacterium]|nr:MAG: TonB family protein [Myxococcales bacterium]